MFELNSLKSNADKSSNDTSSATNYQNDRPATIAMIGPSIRIKGDVRGEESLVIQGQVEGSINLEHNKLIIGQEGQVTATVHAHTVTIEGTLKGDVFGEDRVIVKKNGNVHGNVTAPQVSMEEGAKFKGSIDMEPKPLSPSTTQNVGQSASVYKLGASENKQP